LAIEAACVALPSGVPPCRDRLVEAVGQCMKTTAYSHDFWTKSNWCSVLLLQKGIGLRWYHTDFVFRRVEGPHSSYVELCFLSFSRILQTNAGIVPYKTGNVHIHVASRGVCVTIVAVEEQ